MALLIFRCLTAFQNAIFVGKNKFHLTRCRNQRTSLIGKPNLILETGITIRQKLPIVDYPGKSHLVKDFDAIDFCEESSACLVIRKKETDKSLVHLHCSLIDRIT